ncbi:N-acetyltransferase [Pseudomonas putida]|uniref:N-acetyltransferase n=1 Tax=Pseudomonas putida TaxID=303 RepID=UPI00334BC1DD
MIQAQDPSSALCGFQEALAAGYIHPSRSTLHPDLVVLHDDAEGTLRITYALLAGKTVKAVAVYFLEKTIQGVRVYDVGYAVAHPYRNQGCALAVVEQSLEHLQKSLCGQVTRFYVEAIVPHSNLASMKVAARALAVDPERINDGVSGKSSAKYLRLFEI